MTEFSATNGNFCVPVIDGMVVPQCVTFRLLGDGKVEAECLRLDQSGKLYVIGNEVATITISGNGYAIPIASPVEFEATRQAAGLPMMPLERLQLAVVS